VALVKALPTIIIEVVKAVPEIIKAIVLGFKDGIVQMVQVGKDLIGGVWKGIKDSFTWLWDNVKGFFTDLLNKIKGFLKIGSPSQLMADLIGKNMALGISEGFTDGMGTAAVQMQKAINQGISGLGGNVNLNATGTATGQGRAAAPSSSATTNINYVFNSPKALGAREIQQQMQLAEQRLALIGG